MLMKYLRLAAAFCNAFWILWVRFPVMGHEEKVAAIKHWSQRTLALMDVRVSLDENWSDSHANSPQLLVANHVSWLDVLVIQSLCPSVFVAKSEVRAWPVIGAIAKACGVVFVDRGSPSSARKMVDDVSNALHHGYCVAGFPEGTSSEGLAVGVFHANLFEAAITRRMDVQPVALRYVHPHTRQHCNKAAFVGDLNFVGSLHQVMTAQGIEVQVRMTQRLPHIGHTRRTLAHLSQRTIQAQLDKLSAPSA